MLSAIECADALDALEMADIVARDALLSKRLHQEELDASAVEDATVIEQLARGKRGTTRQLLNHRVKGMLGQPHDVLATFGRQPLPAALGNELGNAPRHPLPAALGNEPGNAPRHPLPTALGNEPGNAPRHPYMPRHKQKQLAREKKSTRNQQAALLRVYSSCSTALDEPVDEGFMLADSCAGRESSDGGSEVDASDASADCGESHCDAAAPSPPLRSDGCDGGDGGDGGSDSECHVAAVAPPLSVPAAAQPAPLPALAPSASAAPIVTGPAATGADAPSLSSSCAPCLGSTASSSSAAVKLLVQVVIDRVRTKAKTRADHLRTIEKNHPTQSCSRASATRSGKVLRNDAVVSSQMAGASHRLVQPSALRPAVGTFVYVRIDERELPYTMVVVSHSPANGRAFRAALKKPDESIVFEKDLSTKFLRNGWDVAPFLSAERTYHLSVDRFIKERQQDLELKQAEALVLEQLRIQRRAERTRRSLLLREDEEKAQDDKLRYGTHLPAASLSFLTVPYILGVPSDPFVAAAAMTPLHRLTLYLLHPHRLHRRLCDHHFLGRWASRARRRKANLAVCRMNTYLMCKTAQNACRRIMQISCLGASMLVCWLWLESLPVWARAALTT